ncbi:MAG: ATP phosphoribosyltransferase regulatory subunit [Pelagibacteraceae bacterium TMED216]|nr:MAG: ATP phosphoribosyltransferase regulatory subunit [Pelagibacteraceae bacterium TMED216]|tara:strand:+ start:1241 stop:2278 length:1038 start_codon:yes stop_codon:yes gene_type:complete
MKSKKLSQVIIKTFKKNGFVLSEPDVLLDSKYIIERSGEKFKSSMLSFEREDGKTMCLRPDLTVASCINFLKKKSSSKIYYSGQAYRRSNNKGSNFINEQLGIEILGSKNQIQDDFKVINTILSSTKKMKSKKIQIKVGDISLFKSLINALDMPERWKLRLIRHFWRPSYFEELLKRLEKNTDIDAVNFDIDKKRFYEMKQMSQSRVVAGRAISEILKRFEKKIKDPRSFRDGKKIVRIIRSFLKINCNLSKLNNTLLSFAKKNNINKNIFKDLKSIQNLKKLNQDINFITNFGRDVEYYTGIVFEVFSGNKELARGGRYDDLLKSLGAKKNIPAVGAAINLKNI